MFNDDTDLIQRIAVALIRRKECMGVAESCTGGLIGAACTSLSGSSQWFERGVISYSDQAKTELLGVPAALIDAKGAVSRDVAIAMAEGALARSAADIALAVTGFADAGDEPGLVHFGCARAGHGTAHREAHFGPCGRGATRIAAIEVAVSMMREILRA